MLCKVCKVDKRNRDFEGEEKTCKWCNKYMPEKNCKDYPKKLKAFKEKLKIKLRKRKFDVIRQDEVYSSLKGVKRSNKTNYPVAWCDCRMVKLKSVSGHYDIVEENGDGYCTKCEHAVQYSTHRPDRNKNLQKFTYNNQYNDWGVYSKNHLKDNDWLPNHSVCLARFTVYQTDDEYKPGEIKTLSLNEIELINEYTLTETDSWSKANETRIKELKIHKLDTLKEK